VRRWLVAAGTALVVVVGGYLLFFSGEEVAPTVTVELPTAMIGSGDQAVGVSPEGTIITEGPPPAEGSLPTLPISQPPKSGVLGGPVLEQARVLGAAPALLRPCVAGSTYGETGVDVELRSGIELRFGDATRAAQKWAAAATVLADPSITALDYVDLHSPGRPGVYGSGHALPSAEEASGDGCGS
jgi:cell division septal protein FtsQ